MKPDSSGRLDFRGEAMERLETARTILETETTPRAPQINELFRAFHSLKGLAGLAGLEKLGKAFHEAESLLDELRLSHVPWSAPIGEALLEFVRLVERSVPRAAEGDDDRFDLDRAMALLNSATAAPAEEQTADWRAELDLSERTFRCLSEYEESRLRSAVTSGWAVYAIDVALSLDELEEGLKALSARLNAAGEMIATLPQAAGSTSERLAVRLLAAAERSLPDLGADARVTRVTRAAAAPAGRTSQRTVRLEKSQILDLASSAEQVRADFERASAAWKKFERTLSPGPRLEMSALRRRLADAVDGLSRQSLAVRTVPLSALADRLSRAAARLLASSGKRARFRVLGGDLSIDRDLAEDLADPLLHLVRNSIDHGLETPADRRQRGKSEEGTISLMARSRSSRLLLSLADDGRGIDEARVRQRAIELNWLPSSGAAASREQLLDFIFQPGFSTAQNVSQISGRGVGLDLVAERVRGRGGEVRVISHPGQGTRFEIEVAVGEAIFEGLLIEEGGNLYAFPLAGVARVEESGDRGMAQPLGELVGSEWSAGSRFHIVLPDESRISVEKVLRPERLVVRPVGGGVQADFLIGAAEGDAERPILVLDPKRLLRSGAARRELA
jgi:two-component system chemotaxis sensor kinase CheA